MEDNEAIARIDNLDKVEKKAKIDPFTTDGELVKSYDGLHQNFKRKISRTVNKAFQGIDDTKSKQLFPEMDMVTAYGLFDVVLPPYNLDELAYFYENSYANHAAINAKVANTVGLGYSFEMTDSTVAKLEESESEDQLMRAQRKIQRTKAQMTEWLESLNDEDTFTHVLEKVYTDVETVGNGYVEIGRKVNGDIGYIGHIPATTIRVRRMRDGYIQIVNQKVVYFRNFQEQRNINPVTSDNRPNELIHIKKYSPKNSYYGVPDTVSAATSMVGNELAAKYNVDYFENKAVPRYIALVKGAKLSPEAEDKFFRFMQAGLRGQNHRTLYIPLPGDGPDNKVDFKLEPIENGIQDGSFEKYRKSNRDDILMAHQVPYSKVMLALKFNELTLTDEQTQSQIDERYLRMQVVVPNEVRERLGYPVRPGGSDPIVLGAQARAEQVAQSTGNRNRDQQRTDNASDSPSTTTGRNAQGEGRSQQ